MTTTDDTRASFAGTFRAMAATLAAAAESIDGESPEYRSVRGVMHELQSFARALDAHDASGGETSEGTAPVLKDVARLVRDRDRALADHWDWLQLPDREVGRMSPDADELLVRVETLILCPECKVGVPRSEATGHICWHQK